MTLTINAQSYAQLLALYQPKVIETEIECDRVITIAEELEHKIDRILEEEAILDLLVTLIERFEAENYPIPEGTPHQMLLHLMEASNIKQENLVGLDSNKFFCVWQMTSGGKIMGIFRDGKMPDFRPK